MHSCGIPIFGRPKRPRSQRAAILLCALFLLSSIFFAACLASRLSHEHSGGLESPCGACDQIRTANSLLRAISFAFALPLLGIGGFFGAVSLRRAEGAPAALRSPVSLKTRLNN
jgi:hypothetical protein